MMDLRTLGRRAGQKVFYIHGKLAEERLKYGATTCRAYALLVLVAFFIGPVTDSTRAVTTWAWLALVAAIVLEAVGAFLISLVGTDNNDDDNDRS